MSTYNLAIVKCNSVNMSMQVTLMTHFLSPLLGLSKSLELTMHIILQGKIYFPQLLLLLSLCVFILEI